jgi:hypothetical protein
VANDYDLTARNVMLDALGAVCTRIALHSGDPGAANTAANELSTGGYARQAVTWNAAAAGSMDNNANPVFSVAAGVTVNWISGWNTAGTVRYFKKAVTAEAFGGAGTYTLSDLDLDLNDA